MNNQVHDTGLILVLKVHKRQNPKISIRHCLKGGVREKWKDQ